MSRDRGHVRQEGARPREGWNRGTDGWVPAGGRTSLSSPPHRGTQWWSNTQPPPGVSLRARKSPVSPGRKAPSWRPFPGGETEAWCCLARGRGQGRGRWDLSAASPTSGPPCLREQESKDVSVFPGTAASHGRRFFNFLLSPGSLCARPLGNAPWAQGHRPGESAEAQPHPRAPWVCSWNQEAGARDGRWEGPRGPGSLLSTKRHFPIKGRILTSKRRVE